MISTSNLNPEQELTPFLVAAKKATYASSSIVDERVLEDGGRELTYADGPLLYRDRFYGEEQFSGQEVVFRGEQPIWSMSYAGKRCSATLDTEAMYAFLKKVLYQIPESAPFRGPAQLQQGNFLYLNKSEGNLDQFSGREQIYYRGELVFELEYQGGRIR